MSALTDLRELIASNAVYDTPTLHAAVADMVVMRELLGLNEDENVDDIGGVKTVADPGDEGLRPGGDD